MSAAPRGLAGPAVLMFTGTAASRILGLVRNAVLALVLTVNVAGAANAFSVANKLPNVIFMLVAGGVLNAVLVPQIVRAMRQEDGGQEYVDRLLTMAGAALAALTLALTAAAALLVSLYGQRLGEWYPLAVAFAFWCIPQLFFYGLYTLLGQVLNARSSFGPYMWAPVVNNVVAIAGLAVFIAVFGTSATNDVADPGAWTAGRVALLAGTATAGVAAQALVLIWPLRRSGFRWSPRWGWRGTGLGRASKVATWAFGGLAVGQVGYVVVSNVAAAAGTAGGTSALVAGNAAYDNAFLVFMLPQSLITVSLVTALFTRMSTNAAAGELDKVRGDLSFGLRTVAVFTVFATAALAVLALPVVRIVLPTVTFDEARSVAVVTLTMLLGLSGLGAWTLVQRVYYAFEDTRSLFFVQIPMAGIVGGGALAAALLLEPRWWVPGAGVAMSASTWFGALVAYRRLRGRLDSLDGARVLRTHVRLVVAVVPAALVGWGVLRWMGVGAGPGAAAPVVVTSSLVRVVVVSVLMLAVYLVLLRVLHVDELDPLARPAVRVVRATMRRVRTMTRGRRATRADEAGGGGPVSGTATSSPLLDEGTVLAGRFRLTEPRPSDLPGTTAWRGRDQVLDRPVQAVRLRGRTMAEALDAARRAALVDDPRLSRVLSVGTHEGEGFVVTDVVAGPDLAELVTHGPLAADVARAVVGETASALEAALRRGVHHLALRPSCVHVSETSQVTVTGLGVDAAQLGRDTRDFWAASRQDAVALVSLLYLALTGVPPEHRPDGEVIPPADLRADVPNDLDTLCVVTLGPHDDGPHSPAEVVRELAPWPGLEAARRSAASFGGPPPGGPGTAAVRTPGAASTPAAVADADRGTGEGPAEAGRRDTAEPRADWTLRETPDPDDDARPPFDAVLAPPADVRLRRALLTAASHRAARHSRELREDAPVAPGTGARPVVPALTATVSNAASAGTRAFGSAAATSGRAVGVAAGTAGRTIGRAVAATGHGVQATAAATARSAGAAASRVEQAVDAVRRLHPERAESGRSAPTARFDPTPYVLALMVALVLFGCIWAVGVLTGGSPDGAGAAGGDTVVGDVTPTPATPADAEAAPDAAATG